MSQLKSPDLKLGKDENLNERCSETIESDLKKAYVSNLESL